MVVGMSLYSQIREAYITGESQRSIAKRLGISRQTVKKYCEGETMPGVRKDYLRAPSVVTTEVESFISMCLEADKDEGLKKQTHTPQNGYTTGWYPKWDSTAPTLLCAAWSMK